MNLRITPGSIESDGHIVLTGPITGTITTSDGTVVDVSAEAVEVDSQEEADEIAQAVAQRYADEGHPFMVEHGDDGEVTQVPFVIDTPEG